MSLVDWIETEARKAERWMRPESGVLRFLLTAPELERIKSALSSPSSAPAATPAKENESDTWEDRGWGPPVSDEEVAAMADSTETKQRRMVMESEAVERLTSSASAEARHFKQQVGGAFAVIMELGRDVGLIHGSPDLPTAVRQLHDATARHYAKPSPELTQMIRADDFVDGASAPAATPADDADEIVRAGHRHIWSCEVCGRREPILPVSAATPAPEDDADELADELNDCYKRLASANRRLDAHGLPRGGDPDPVSAAERPGDQPPCQWCIEHERAEADLIRRLKATERPAPTCATCKFYFRAHPKAGASCKKNVVIEGLWPAASFGCILHERPAAPRPGREET